MTLFPAADGPDPGGPVAEADDGPGPDAAPGDGFIALLPVATVDGPVRISRLCEKRLGLHVLSYDAGRAEWAYRPVVGWRTARARVADLVTIDHAAGGCLYATKDQPVLRPDGTVGPVGALTPGDELATWGPVATADQWDFMLGSLLGDASATEVAFTCEHSVKQAAYVAWKQSILAGLGAITFDRGEREKPSSYAGKVIRSSPSRIVAVGHRHVFEALRRTCYDAAGLKRVSQDWLARVGGWASPPGSSTTARSPTGPRSGGRSTSRATSRPTASSPRTARPWPTGWPVGTAAPARSTASAPCAPRRT